MNGNTDFNNLAVRMEEKIYRSAKGLIRLSLLIKDLNDYIPGFKDSMLYIDDIGGGSGRFAESCVQAGHRIRIIDKSEAMIKLAGKRLKRINKDAEGRIELIQADYLADQITPPLPKRDLICLHGSAEWMESSELAIRKACSDLEPGCFLSLLIFNADRQNLKLGINGQLHPSHKAVKRRRLTPPGGLTPQRVREMLAPEGDIILQSGIRIFHDFFRQFDPGTLSDQEWLEQEMEWYRKEPFNGLGEHSHFILMKK